jgi:hypothetical protein
MGQPLSKSIRAGKGKRPRALSSPSCRRRVILAVVLVVNDLEVIRRASRHAAELALSTTAANEREGCRCVWMQLFFFVKKIRRTGYSGYSSQLVLNTGVFNSISTPVWQTPTLRSREREAYVASRCDHSSLPPLVIGRTILAQEGNQQTAPASY